jgi:hypothetical protein
MADNHALALLTQHVSVTNSEFFGTLQDQADTSKLLTFPSNQILDTIKPDDH